MQTLFLICICISISFVFLFIYFYLLTLKEEREIKRIIKNGQKILDEMEEAEEAYKTWQRQKTLEEWLKKWKKNACL